MNTINNKNRKYILLLIGLLATLSLSAQRSGRKLLKKEVIKESLLIKSITNKQTIGAESQEKETVLYEDFSKFEAGNEANPDTEEISDYETGEIPEKYTNLPGWEGVGVFQAGGCCYLDVVDYGGGNWDTGLINTPFIDLSKMNGRYVLTFRARSAHTQGDILNILSGSVTTVTGIIEASLESQWKEYQFECTNGIDGTIFQLYADTYPCFIDDIEISYQLAAPVIRPATEIGTDKFTANWRSVEGANAYLLNVYSYDQSDKDYFLRDQEVSQTSFTVMNIDPGTQYYYTVRATNGTLISEESEEMKVEEREPETSPKLLEPTNISVNGNIASFTANFEKMDDINRYYFCFFETYTAEKEEIIEVLSEDFSKITEGTLTNPVYYEYEGDLDDYTHAPGWEALCPAFANGMLGLSDRSMFSSFVYSPQYDLSANDGKFTVTLSAVSSKGNSWIVGKHCEYEPSGEKTDRRQLTFENDKQTYELDFFHENTRAAGGVNLFFTTAETGRDIFIDDIKITKSLNKGDHMSYIHSSEIVGADQQTISIPISGVEIKPGYTYSYAVVVMRSAPAPVHMEFFGYDIRMPVELNTVHVENNLIDNNAPFTYLSHNSWYVELQQDALIEIYTLTGKRLSGIQGKVGENILPLHQKGVYLIKVGDYITKVIW